MSTHELSERARRLLETLEDLTGQKTPLDSTAPEDALALLDQEGRGLGYSQLNELFLLLGYDRITLGFFQYLVDDSLEYRTGSALHSLEQLQDGTERFRKLALLYFGNVKFAFKNLSQSPEMLEYYWLETQPRDEGELTSRHDPVQPLIPIPGRDTFYLGYIVQRDLQHRLAKVQETDTLGKDSELASTLAQGKPVIAFVPQADETYAAELLARLQETYPEKSERELILEQLRIFEPGAAWNDSTVREWLSEPDRFQARKAKERLALAIREHYDKRARMLRDDHPLGIQVNLETGVANGVLVARSVEECSELIRRVLTRTLEFKLEVKWFNGMKYVLLRETVSGSIFRVMSGDPMLTNAFWNFYLGD